MIYVYFKTDLLGVAFEIDIYELFYSRTLDFSIVFGVEFTMVEKMNYFQLMQEERYLAHL